MWWWCLDIEYIGIGEQDCPDKFGFHRLVHTLLQRDPFC